MITYENKKPFEFDFDGACAPTDGASFISNTFSLGIFQWIPAKSGGLKRSRVLKRIRGDSSKPEETFAQARNMIESLQKEFGYNFHPDLKKEK